jgi:sortase A
VSEAGTRAGRAARQAAETRQATARRRNLLFGALGVLGELLATAGVLVLLFLVWQLWWVARAEMSAQTAVAQSLAQQFASGQGAAPTGGPSNPTDPTAPPGPIDGSAFALLRVPRMGGPQMVLPIYEGVGSDVLAKGVGHYPKTQLPGEIGNVAIAAHRVTHGNPFIDIDRMRPGDVIVIETRDRYAVYRTVRSIIVAPTAIEVIAPVPQHPGQVPTEPWLTMTSCEPKFSGASRYIVFAKLEATFTRAQGLPTELLQAPGD